MPPNGPSGVDLRSILQTVHNVIKRQTKQVCSAPCDGLVLRMHYSWTFFLLLGNFLMVWHSWYYNEVITCVSNFNADSKAKQDYINICLSYPFVEGNGPRRYILFYRWIKWSLLVLAGVYYIPWKVSKGIDNARCKKLLEDLASNAHHYEQLEDKLWEKQVKRAGWYVISNLKTHNSLYWKYLGVNILALVIDLSTMYYLHFTLQNRFIQYGFKAFPFDRDSVNFTDYMSQTFPPFVSCELNYQNRLVNMRTEKFGCHLTIMELYEKVFLGLWLWLIALIFITFCHIVFLLTMWLPCVRAYLLRTSKTVHADDKVQTDIHKVLKDFMIGDMYLLYRLKGHFSHVRFYQLMRLISDRDQWKKMLPKDKEKKDPLNSIFEIA
ncbi:innexin-10-like [Eriocheir sinensis]|uniref:innexin-10-like n=1 Tax=Eriocheir sinensis TaxID=95602 RepID=UPI0021C6C14B|nr:innexin-10-like [Eriocheir sinensis]